jgi:FixJ family two-component response regulator
MTISQGTIYIVDDDKAVRESLTMLLEAAGHTVKTFSGAKDFLDICVEGSDLDGCIILDVNMPGMDGPALQEELLRRGIQMPMLFLSGHGTIQTTVRTMKAGAMDFLTKPVEGEILLERVQEALERSSQIKKQVEEHQTIASRLSALTEREREVMALAIAGHTSKEIAQQLNISFRTVEIHRAHVMQKTGASNLLELARIAWLADPHEH